MSDKDKTVKFKSGATSSVGHDAPYWLNTGHGERLTALRSGYGNEKHEESRTVLSTANWLQAFHERDLEFWRNRYVHARDHLDNEMKGRFDSAPGGNLGGVGWFVDRMAFIRENDYIFYLSVVGLIPHPGKREDVCKCEYCKADDPSKAWVPGPPVWVISDTPSICTLCNTIVRGNDRHACAPEWCGQTPNLCPHCNKTEGTCKCL